MAYEFLSDDWFNAVLALPAPPSPPSAAGLTVNVVVTRDEGSDVEMHMHEGTMQRGLSEQASTTLTTPYSVARALFVEQDQNAAMQAFMSGRIKVAGDMTKLMAMGQQAPSPEQEAYAKEIRSLTIL